MPPSAAMRSEEHTSELQSREKLVCRLLLEKKKKKRWKQSANAWTSPNPGSPGCMQRALRCCEPYWSNPASSSFFFNDTATTEIYTLSLHDALPISAAM